MTGPRNRISVISTSCRFPDAASPAELWANLLEGRRSFRAIPPQRLDIARYASDLVGEADSITRIKAGLLTNWKFDRSRFRIPEKTFAAADLTHWLALELAAEAIAGMGGPERLNRAQTAVVVANTMAGEFSRAALLRLRLPFLEEILEQAVDADGLSAKVAAGLRQRFAASLRSRFSEPNEDSLAGGLANTIAGRIANHFDLKGGAYSVDGACASSLVAIADAANLLVAGQVDAVVVAAVDLSLDPFELVGFSRNGALAADEMRVFDRRAGGFWPGEGGGCAVLMREEDARRRGVSALATIRGWGLSTDGSGGLTRPSWEGQLSACRRAYEMAGADPADTAFVEAHGTGTAVGDPIEVRALAALHQTARSPVRIGSIKANIGHTKAAAGFAGLIKAVEALHQGVLPPHVGCVTPHPVFAEVDHRVRPALAGEPIEARGAAIAGVSSFGFGGINAHVVLEQAVSAKRPALRRTQPVAQDAELFLFSGDSLDEITAQFDEIRPRAAGLSMAELADAAAHAASGLRDAAIRVAIVAGSGSELAVLLSEAGQCLLMGQSPAGRDDLFIGRRQPAPRIGFIFPGQAAPCRPDGGIWRRRFACTADLEERMLPFAGKETSNTDVAQPVIVASSLAALRILQRLGITAGIAAGHSLGEITALAWAGVLNDSAAIDLAVARGSVMAGFGVAGGAMLRVPLTAVEAEEAFGDCGTVVACHNGPSDTVIAGSAGAIAAAARRCATRHIDAARLVVSHAFHSPDMDPAKIPLMRVLEGFRFKPAGPRIISTVTGEPLAADTDVPRLLADQLTGPVLFDRALERMAAETDLLVEVGPGRGLTRLARDRGLAAVSIDARGDSLRPLLASVGALFAAGADVNVDMLFEGRCVRAFDSAAVPEFIASPCGSRNAAPAIERRAAVPPPAEPVELAAVTGGEPLAVVISVVAAETGLDPSGIGADDRFLDALHLNSLAVGRIVRSVAKSLNARPPSVPTEFANATPRMLAEAMQELREFGGDAAGKHRRIGGVRNWVRTYAMRWETAPAPQAGDNLCRWLRIEIDPVQPAAGEPEPGAGLLVEIDGPLTMLSAQALIARVGGAAKAGVAHLALVHDGQPVAAFARSVASEGHFRSVRVIDRGGAGIDDPRLGRVLTADVEGYYELRLSEGEGMERPAFLPTSPASSLHAAIAADDVVVVVGGGKGIAAECVQRLAAFDAAVIIVGRSPAEDPDVSATLDRARGRGMRCRYVRADVLDGAALRTGLAPATEEFGPATVLIYAPAVNEPMRLTDIDAEAARRALAPKILGLETALQVLGPQLRRLVTFGSIIGRIGLEGEAHYALANAMQTAATESWAASGRDRTALAIEWSLWGGAGMGERLGTVERLAAQGVDALSVDDALDAFVGLLAGNAIGTAVVTSRFGPPPALSLGASELPMLRFVDEPRVHFPGVELVTETSISHGRDPYLADHVVEGLAVLPGVMGLEAMSQVAAALMPLGDRIAVSNVVFARAVQVAADANLRIRIAGLRIAERTVEVALFAEDDGFATPCMRALFSDLVAAMAPIDAPPASSVFSAAALYGPLFFGGPRFQRLDCFEVTTSREVAARLRSGDDAVWFGRYEPDTLVLWEPGSADATLHALQAAVPHKRVLPVSAGRIDIDRTAGAPVRVRAWEKAATADTYTFDIVAADADDRVVFQWSDIAFRTAGRIDIAPVLTAAPQLGCPFLERTAREALGDETIAVALAQDGDGSRESRRADALQALHLDGLIERRADGRPLRRDGRGSISLAHDEAVCLAVTAEGPVSCDIAAARQASSDELRRHVGFEVCRKLDRRPVSVRAAESGAVAVADDVAFVIVDLPTPSGSHTVGFGCVRHPDDILLQRTAPSVSKAVS